MTVNILYLCIFCFHCSTVGCGNVVTAAAAAPDSPALIALGIKSIDVREAGRLWHQAYDDDSPLSLKSDDGDTAAPAPVQLIIDTDMSSDVDDVAAVCAAHALADRGEAELVAVVHNTGLVQGAGAISVINHYYGRDDVPIGAFVGAFDNPLVTPNRYGAGSYVLPLVVKFPSPIRNSSQVPSGVEVYRKVLSAADDRSVTISSIGFMSNLAALIESKPDRISSLSGVELVAKKVRLVAWMGGQYPNSTVWQRFRKTGAEWNFGGGNTPGNTITGPWTATAVNKWPATVPIVFSGFEMGAQIFTGAPMAGRCCNQKLTKPWTSFTCPQGHDVACTPHPMPLPPPQNACQPVDSPCRAAFEFVTEAENAHGRPNNPPRQSWDPATTLFAVRGAGLFWDLHSTGYNSVNKTGANQWLDDGKDHNRSYLVLKLGEPTGQPGWTAQRLVAHAIDDLLCAKPKLRPLKLDEHSSTLHHVSTALGTRNRRFFFDRLEISDSVGVDIKLHRPTEAPELAMTYDEPWENLRSFGYNSVVDNGTHVLLYYFIFTAFPWPDGPRGTKHDEIYKEQWYTCLATSADGGKTFVKPRLGVIEINGSTDNNCVWPPGGWNATHHETGTVFIDSKPGVPPSQRYKMIATNPGSASSPDGIHWTPDGGLWTGSDTQQVAWWDEQHQQYVGYRRQWWETKEAKTWRVNDDFCVPTGESHGVEDGKPRCGKQDLAGRQVGRCMTNTWGEWEGCMRDTNGTTPAKLSNTSDLVFSYDSKDPPGLDVYINQAVPYHDQYLMMPSMYLHFGSMWPRGNDGLWGSRLVHSRDGLNFSYIGGDRRPWASRGASTGISPLAEARPGSAWDSGMVAMARGIVVRDEFLILFKWGDSLTHHQCTSSSPGPGYCDVPRHIGATAGIARLQLRIDGFASASPAASQNGEWPATDTDAAWLRTNTYTVPTNAELHLNVKVGITAELLVEVLLPSGKPVPNRSRTDCVAVIGDFLDTTVVWLAGRTMKRPEVSLRFLFKGQVDLFSFWFQDPPLAKSDDAHASLAAGEMLRPAATTMIQQ